MTKSTIKSNIKKTYIKDRAIIKFIKEHSKIQKINFSKIKIPSFIDIRKNKERNKDYKFSKNNLDSNNIFIGENKIISPISFPKLKLSILNYSTFGFNQNNNNPKIHSLLFN